MFRFRLPLARARVLELVSGEAGRSGPGHGQEDRRSGTQRRQLADGNDRVLFHGHILPRHPDWSGILLHQKRRR